MYFSCRYILCPSNSGSNFLRYNTPTTVARELAKCKLDLGALKIRLDKRGMVRAGDVIFFIENETKIINWEQTFWYTNG